MSKSKKSDYEASLLDDDWKYADGDDDSELFSKSEHSKSRKNAKARRRYEQMMEERMLRKMLDDDLSY